jgi:hypothetical protein
MSYIHSYSELSDKELFNVLSNNEKWTKEAQDTAWKELLNRNYTVDQITEGKDKRVEIIERSIQRSRRQRQENAKLSYTWIEAIAVLLTFPISFILVGNPLTEFARLEEFGYKKKIWQRIILIFLSILFWVWVITLIG